MEPLRTLESQAYNPEMSTAQKIYTNQELLARLEGVARAILDVEDSVASVHRLPLALRQVLVDKLLEVGQTKAKNFVDKEVAALLLNVGKYKPLLIPELLTVGENSVEIHSHLLSQDAIGELLSSIVDPQTITKIDLASCRKLVSLAWLSRFPQTEVLDVPGTGIKNLEGVSDCPVLQRVNITDCKEVESLQGLRGSTVKILEASGCTKLQDISALSGTAIEDASFSGCRSVKDFDPIKTLANSLSRLTIQGCPRFSDNSIVESLVHLKFSEFNESGVHNK